MIRSATVWTRPAESPRQTFFQSSGRDLVADEPVDDAPRLLGVDASFESISPAFSMAASTAFLVISLKRTRRNVVVLRGSGLQRLAQVPGDRFALAVGVGREDRPRPRSWPRA